MFCLGEILRVGAAVTHLDEKENVRYVESRASFLHRCLRRIFGDIPALHASAAARIASGGRCCKTRPVVYLDSPPEGSIAMVNGSVPG